MSRQIFWDVSKKWKVEMWHRLWNCELSLECVLKLSWVSQKDSWSPSSYSRYYYWWWFAQQDACARFSGWIVRWWRQFQSKMAITMSSYVKMSWSKMSSFFLKKKRRELVNSSVSWLFLNWSNKSSSSTSIFEVTLGEFVKQLFHEFPPLTPKFSISLGWRVFKTTLMFLNLNMIVSLLMRLLQPIRYSFSHNPYKSIN